MSFFVHVIILVSYILDLGLKGIGLGTVFVLGKGLRIHVIDSRAGRSPFVTMFNLKSLSGLLLCWATVFGLHAEARALSLHGRVVDVNSPDKGIGAVIVRATFVSGDEAEALTNPNGEFRMDLAGRTGIVNLTFDRILYGSSSLIFEIEDNTGSETKSISLSAVRLIAIGRSLQYYEDAIDQFLSQSSGDQSEWDNSWLRSAFCGLDIEARAHIGSSLTRRIGPSDASALLPDLFSAAPCSSPRVGQIINKLNEIYNDNQFTSLSTCKLDLVEISELRMLGTVTSAYGRVCSYIEVNHSFNIETEQRCYTVQRKVLDEPTCRRGFGY